MFLLVPAHCGSPEQRAIKWLLLLLLLLLLLECHYLPMLAVSEMGVVISYVCDFVCLSV